MKIQVRQNKRVVPAMAKGFSLFEMVIVMGIIGLILGGAIYTMGNIRDTAAIGTADSSMKNLESGLEAYRGLANRFPTTEQGLEALFKKPSSSPVPRRWNQTVKKEDGLLDPWGTKFKYQFPGSKDERNPEIISAGPDRKFGTEDDLSNQD